MPVAINACEAQLFANEKAVRNFVIICLVFLAATAVRAQVDSDTTTVYLHGIPVSEDDTVSNFPGRDLAPSNQYRKVEYPSLPAGLSKELNNNKIFEGYDRQRIFFDPLNKRYYVYIRLKDIVRIYGLSAEGKVLTFDEQPE